jgi:stage II sporulation protein D
MEELMTAKYKVMHKKRHWLQLVLIGLASFLAIVVLVPVLMTKGLPSSKSTEIPAAAGEYNASGFPDGGEPGLTIPVYLSKDKKVQQLDLEQYVRGVVAAEMPIDFELEALKAQAMAARTYIVRRLLEKDLSGVPVEGAVVTDTITHQAYVSEQELKQRWSGSQYAANMDKLHRAVAETKDLILTYEGKPIQATFFSTSNGYTENSEDYWGDRIAYLRSVPSPWDVKLSPRYKETISISSKELVQKLGLRTAVPVSANQSNSLRVIGKTESNRIKTLTVGGKMFTGREFREKLGLNSTHFQWSWKGSELQITTFGYGHGVGMSQWGANGMAKEGKKAEEIVKYFYTGIQISSDTSLLKGKSF